eukprot:1410210-Heterocapsa_arctica.AAC.1
MSSFESLPGFHDVCYRPVCHVLLDFAHDMVFFWISQRVPVWVLPSDLVIVALCCNSSGLIPSR